MEGRVFFRICISFVHAGEGGRGGGGGRSWFQAFLAEAVETGDENRSMHVLCRKLRKD